MKEIKEKPVGGKTRAPKTKVMQSVPKTAIQQAMIKSRDKVKSSMTDATGPQQDGNYTDAASMEQQIQTGVAHGTKQTAAAAYHAGKKLAQHRAEQRRTREAAWAAEEAAAPVLQPNTLDTSPTVSAPASRPVAPDAERAALQPQHRKPAPKIRKAPRAERPPLRLARTVSPTPQMTKTALRQQEQGRKLEIMVPEGGLPLDFGLQWPLPVSGSITSPFGYRTDPLTGEVSYHSGTDIAAPNGTPILAAAAGTVTVANALDSWGGSYGFYVKIDHANGVETLYAHCSAICVTEGEQVQAGQVIAYVGSTGRSTGNHLHFEVYKDGALQSALA